MKISIIGTHGIPARYGGFETFAEQLALACANAGIKVRVVNEKSNPLVHLHENIEIIPSRFNKGESPLKFYRDSLRIAEEGSDIILCCGVGGAFHYKAIRKKGIRILTNVDGLEHLRKKYSLFQRAAVYLLQNYAAAGSSRIIADSHSVEKYWMKRFPKIKGKIRMISYGAGDCEPFDPSVLDALGLEKNEYFLAVARLVPENNVLEMVDAMRHYIGRKKLVITGKLEDTPYVRQLKENSNDKVLFTDAIYDKRILDSLRQGCYIYLHGHSVGGTNPSLLEALKAGCGCICHDNVFNREVTGDSQLYFDTWDDLSIILNLLEHKAADIDELKMRAAHRSQNYTWGKIFNSYIELFNRLLKNQAVTSQEE
jgi:glycosyltransferase involved in cell wall biosynthesis